MTAIQRDVFTKMLFDYHRASLPVQLSPRAVIDWDILWLQHLIANCDRARPTL
jgi:hypothetical protein